MDILMSLLLLVAIFLGAVSGYILSIMAVEEINGLRKIISFVRSLILLIGITLSSAVLLNNWYYAAIIGVVSLLLIIIVGKFHDAAYETMISILVILLSCAVLFISQESTMVIASLIFIILMLSVTLSSDDYLKKKRIRVYEELSTMHRRNLFLVMLAKNWLLVFIPLLSFIASLLIGGVV
jgi:hypothetical protein